MAGRRLRLTGARRAAVVTIVLVSASAAAEEPLAPTPESTTAQPPHSDTFDSTPSEPAATSAPERLEEPQGALHREESSEPVPLAPPRLVPVASEGPDEVRVRGTKNEPTAPKDTIGGREIRQVPGAFGDAFRALESLPGVTPIVSGLPYFFVRGAPPGNTGFFIDGVRVPGLFHLGVGPAVMYPAIIERVDLFKGAYPTSFGRFAGGILSADTVRPSDRARADWTLRLFDLGALVESPFGRQGDGVTPKGNVLVSGRYGYPGLLLSLLAPDASLAYWDYQTRVSYNLSDRDVVSIFSFGSYDAVSQREDTGGIADRNLTEVLNIQFHRFDLRWDRKTSSTGSVRTALTLGYDRTGSQGFAARSLIFGARMIAQERLSDSVQVRGGADLLMQTYDFRLGTAEGDGGIPKPDEAPSSGIVGIQKDANMAFWFDAPLKLGRRIDVTPGLRADIFTSRGIGRARAIPSLDPRVTTRIGIGPIYHIGAVGVAHQPAAFPVPIPALTFAQLRRGLQAGYHLSQGIEVPMPLDFTGQVTGYLHTYTGIVDVADQCDVEDPRCDPSSARGKSVGMEVMLKRNLGKRIGGWISYTLSRSTRDAYDVALRRQTSRLSEFDRTHVLNVVVSVDLGRHFRVGGRYSGYSGIPYSNVSQLLLPNARTPAFHRVDLRLEKRWYRKSGNFFAFTAEVFNALLMKEAIGVTCVSGFPPSCKPEEIGPIAIPSLGFEGTL